MKVKSENLSYLEKELSPKEALSPGKALSLDDDLSPKEGFSSEKGISNGDPLIASIKDLFPIIHRKIQTLKKSLYFEIFRK